MKSKTKFFIGFLSAAITFGSLMATLGPTHFKHHKHRCGHHENTHCANQHSEFNKESMN